MFAATAPGKVILFGEHAVVYGRPALAAPVTHLRARAVVAPTGRSDVSLIAPDLGRTLHLSTATANNPLAATIHAVAEYLGRSLAAGYDLTNVITTFPAATSVTMVGLFYNRVLDVQAIRRAMTDPNLKLITKDYLESVQTQG